MSPNDLSDQWLSDAEWQALVAAGRVTREVRIVGDVAHVTVKVRPLAVAPIVTIRADYPRIP